MMYLLAFIALPLIEIALFVQIGGAIGLWPTLGFVVASFALGLWVLRRQGMRSADELRRAAAGAVDPTEPLAHGALIGLAAVLLMLPGFLTSACGLLLLVAPLRAVILRRMAGRMRVASFGFSGLRRGGEAPDPAAEIIEAEYHEVTDRPASGGAPSGWTRR